LVIYYVCVGMNYKKRYFDSMWLDMWSVQSSIVKSVPWKLGCICLNVYNS
jgi:hypothetical protein